MRAGRPAKYKADFAKQAKKLCEIGATDYEIADFLGINTLTVYRWKAQHPEFCKALIAGKEKADERVVRSLYQRAVGYTFESEKVFHHQGEITRAPTVEHVPPDTGAAMSWLKNRRGAEWRDKVDHEHTGKDGESISFAILPVAVDGKTSSDP